MIRTISYWIRYLKRAYCLKKSGWTKVRVELDFGKTSEVRWYHPKHIDYKSYNLILPGEYTDNHPYLSPSKIRTLDDRSFLFLLTDSAKEIYLELLGSD